MQQTEYMHACADVTKFKRGAMDLKFIFWQLSFIHDSEMQYTKIILKIFSQIRTVFVTKELCPDIGCRILTFDRIKISKQRNPTK